MLEGAGPIRVDAEQTVTDRHLVPVDFVRAGGVDAERRHCDVIAAAECKSLRDRTGGLVRTVEPAARTGRQRGEHKAQSCSQDGDLSAAGFSFDFHH